MNTVFGRDKVVARIWRLLEEHSIVFTAERLNKQEGAENA